MEIDELIKLLEYQGKNTLADVIKHSGSLSISEYSKNLWNYTTNIALEPELVKAFEMEFKRLGINENIWDEIIKSLQKHRSIQTAPHTGLLDSTSLPALTLHSLALNSIPDDAYYIVGTFSGIPFGNDSYPGVLSFNLETDFKYIIDEKSPYYNSFKKSQADRMRDVVDEKFNRVSLYNNKDRDDLVYRSLIPEQFKKIYPYLTNPIKNYLKYQDSDTDFTKVMLASAQNFSRELFNNDKIIYLDINEVINNYLCIVLQNENHFIYKMFFDNEMHKQIMNIWSKDTHFFYDLVEIKNGKKQVNAYIDSLILKNNIKEEHITPSILINKLQNERLCPGVFLGFTILSFLNGFQCFGSFKQITYLTDYKNTWLKSGLLPFDINDVKTDSLTTGALPDIEHRYKTAVDIILGANWEKPNKDIKFNDILLPIQDRLIGFK